jgi:GNAT superfamily N-acetyltransferase
MSRLQVRLAGRADTAAIADMNMAMAWETERVRLDAETLHLGILAVFDDPRRGFYAVAECAGQTTGCLLVTYEWSDWRCGLFWWLQSLYVRPAFRRQGVFRHLHGFVVERASRQPGVCGIRLYVEGSNRAARSAYERIGLTRRSYRIYEQTLVTRPGA